MVVVEVGLSLGADDMAFGMLFESSREWSQKVKEDFADPEGVDAYLDTKVIDNLLDEADIILKDIRHTNAQWKKHVRLASQFREQFEM